MSANRCDRCGYELSEAAGALCLPCIWTIFFEDLDEQVLEGPAAWQIDDEGRFDRGGAA